MHATPLMRVVWYGMMALDKKLPNIAPRVGIAIGRYFNNNTGETFVSQARLAADIGMSEREVWGAIRVLKARGHLEVKHGGRGSNQYRMPIKKVAAECELYLKKGRKMASRNVTNIAADCERTLSKINSTEEGSGKMDEGKQATGKPAVFPTYSKQWLAWLDYHEVIGNHARAELMRHTAENGRWGEWSEPTPFPPPYAVNRKQADNR
jgi:hypothetical protein